MTAIMLAISMTAIHISDFMRNYSDIQMTEVTGSGSKLARVPLVL